MSSLVKWFLKLKADFMQLIDKNYLNKKLKSRKGKCKQCGKCCKGCKYLDKKTKLCKVYKNRPFLCYPEFPLSKFDQKIWKTKNCGYQFKS